MHTRVRGSCWTRLQTSGEFWLYMALTTRGYRSGRKKGALFGNKDDIRQISAAFVKHSLFVRLIVSTTPCFDPLFLYLFVETHRKGRKVQISLLVTLPLSLHLSLGLFSLDVVSTAPEQI